MSRTLQLTTELSDSRELTIHLPEDVPTGRIYVFLKVVPESEQLLEDRARDDANRIFAELRAQDTLALESLTDIQRDSLVEALLKARREVASGDYLTHAEMRSRWLAEKPEAL